MAAEKGAAKGPEYDEVLNTLSEYAKDRVERVLKEMLYKVFLSTPQDPIQFMIDYLKQVKEMEMEGPPEEEEASEDAPRRELAALPVIGTQNAPRVRRGAGRPVASALHLSRGLDRASRYGSMDATRACPERRGRRSRQRRP